MHRIVYLTDIYLIGMRGTDKYHRSIGRDIESTSGSYLTEEDIDDELPEKHGYIIANMGIFWVTVTHGRGGRRIYNGFGENS